MYSPNLQAKFILKPVTLSNVYTWTITDQGVKLSLSFLRGLWETPAIEATESVGTINEIHSDIQNGTQLELASPLFPPNGVLGVYRVRPCPPVQSY